DVQLPLLKIEPVQVSDLQLSARRGTDLPGKLGNSAVVEVETCNCIAGLRRRGLFFDISHAAVTVEFHYAVPLGVVDGIGEHGSAFGSSVCAVEQRCEIMAM